MKHYSIQKMLSLLLCFVLIAAMALTANGCSGRTQPSGEEAPAAVTMEDGKTYGEGSTEFTFTVLDPDGKELSATIKTDKNTVGEALMELGLIDGEQGEYGLYVKSVNGIPLDYEKDGKYWAFYENGEYGMTGVDLTEIIPGSTYGFRAE